ncbi:hypothetical protein [Cellulomonas phragmiteti]|uniref:Tat pathway signal sequence domain protein n=1 Tax=Cellulomonas phragmiteti TaxID=478780 RepID=A0ABQ4DJH7_9CELL|nr:hypothetical protein [Cellulomonas phragmiteti]GIG39510.1 hypothetical protein Cph01nite_12720 [Cellulomonas phragmiteti]
MTRTLSLRPARLLLAAALVAAGGVALPATAAHASPVPFSVSVTGGYNNTVALGTVTGTITSTGASTADYTATLCGRSSYASTFFTLTAGGVTASHSVSNQSCQTFTGTLTSGSAITTATATVTSGTFYPGNTYTTYTRNQTVVVTSTPAPTLPPATPTTRTVSVAVTGGYNNTVPLGTATGSITGTRGGTSASYSVTLCGRSSYASTFLSITAGGASASHSVSNQSCQTFTGTLTSGSAFTGATVSVTSGTFYPGSTYTTYTRTQNVAF